MIESDRPTIRDAEKIAVVILVIVETKQGKLESAESSLKTHNGYKQRQESDHDSLIAGILRREAEEVLKEVEKK